MANHGVALLLSTSAGSRFIGVNCLDNHGGFLSAKGLHKAEQTVGAPGNAEPQLGPLEIQSNTPIGLVTPSCHVAASLRRRKHFSEACPVRLFQNPVSLFKFPNYYLK